MDINHEATISLQKDYGNKSTSNIILAKDTVSYNLSKISAEELNNALITAITESTKETSWCYRTIATKV